MGQIRVVFSIKNLIYYQPSTITITTHQLTRTAQLSNLPFPLLPPMRPLKALRKHSQSNRTPPPQYKMFHITRHRVNSNKEACTRMLKQLQRVILILDNQQYKMISLRGGWNTRCVFLEVRDMQRLLK